MMFDILMLVLGLAVGVFITGALGFATAGFAAGVVTGIANVFRSKSS